MAAYDKAHELARELKNSDEYKEYHAAQQAIEGNEAALAILKDYRKKRMDFEVMFLTGKELSDKDKEEMEKLNEIVSMHGAVKRFLDAENRVMVMMADIQRILTEALEPMEIQ